MQRTDEILEQMERTKWQRVGKTLLKDWRLYALLLPLMIYMVLFKYMPLYGILMGFKRYNATQGIMEMEWKGLHYAQQLLAGDTAATFWRAFRNTFMNSIYGLVFGFPIPIILALLFSEIKNTGYRGFLQVCAYLPKFLSTVVTSTIIAMWCSAGSAGNSNPGMLNTLFSTLGWTQEGATRSLLEYPKFFRPIYQVSGVWEGAGYGSIVYFAAVVAISPTNYEAAKIDGASKLQEIRYVTFPGMAPTLSIMLIMQIGRLLNIGYEKTLLLYTQNSYESADIVSTLVYRWAASEGATSTAGTSMGVIADLFNSVIAMVLVLGANAISRRVTDTSLF